VQIDDLDLAWEDDIDRGRHRRGRSGGGGGRSGRKRKKKGRGKTFLALFFSLVVLGGVAFGFYYGADRIRDLLTTPDYSSAGEGEVTIEVTSGQTARDIGQTLAKNDVVKSAKAFVNAAEANPRSKEIQPGFYKMRQKMRATDALDMLLNRENRVVKRVTLTEGLTYKATFNKLSEGTGIPVAEFEAAAQNPIALGIPEFWFNRSDGKQARKSVEGFLFPDTYEFGPNVTATDVLKKLVARFMEIATSIDLIKIAESKSVTPFSALINASLIQGEAGNVPDMAKISRVIYNRLNKKMNLEFDSTTNYWRELNGQPRKFNLNDTELLDPNNPYRTYGLAGLPPGPIGNPGKDAMLAAINPTPNQPWLYFVRIDKAGNSAFTDSFAQHQRNIETAKRNGAY
jgi:UPF0755 protein